ncbi:hypothetical protein BDW60DRAFT_180723 [Aspergillus nidulans var. acristatus]
MMATGLLSEFPVEFAKQHNRRWLVSAYEAGDVVLHKPHAIHASTINKDSEGVIRLATDLRFCDSSKPYDKVCRMDFSGNVLVLAKLLQRWMNPYRFGDGV